MIVLDVLGWPGFTALGCYSGGLHNWNRVFGADFSIVIIRNHQNSIGKFKCLSMLGWLGR